ncbi:hypothetical protein AB0O07_15040 [Streptomyces sp. NPDC093085]|uniref:hypothetical protein n=1 Tax=Streptomyces sp. NPDC093085 TaxID=3155068 RepID=UPI0034285DA6
MADTQYFHHPREARAAHAAGVVRGGAGRRSSADPVKALLHRHRALCERAVDPLEIAAGLEAHGITDRTAARFRHRDVFSLAEELYARAPHHTHPRGGEGTAGGHQGTPHPGPYDSRYDTPYPGSHAAPYDGAHAGVLPGPHAGTPPAPHPGAHPGVRSGEPAAPRSRRRPRAGRASWAGLVLLPGAIASLTLVGLGHTSGQGQLATGLAGAFALSGTLSACLRRGPLRAEGRTVPAAGLWTYALLAYLICGDGLLAALLAGGPDGPWPATLTPLVTLAVAVAPAAWCAHLFSVRARRALAASRGLADFAARARPLLLGTVALHGCALAALAVLTRLVHAGSVALTPTVALGTLFLLARLLTVHGRPESAAAGLATAAVLEFLACASVLAARIPGAEALAAPVRTLVHAGGPAAVPALACGAAALGLLVHAAVALSRASAHT